MIILEKKIRNDDFIKVYQTDIDLSRDDSLKFWLLYISNLKTVFNVN